MSSPKRSASKSPKRAGSKSPKKGRGRRKSPAKQVSPHKAHSREQLREMTKRQLGELLLKKGLPVSGKKEELVDRLITGTYKPRSRRRSASKKKAHVGRPRKSPGKGRKRKASPGGRTRFIYTHEGLDRRTKAELLSLARRFDLSHKGKSKESLVKDLVKAHGEGKRARRTGTRRKRTQAK